MTRGSRSLFSCACVATLFVGCGYAVTPSGDSPYAGTGGSVGTGGGLGTGGNVGSGGDLGSGGSPGSGGTPESGGTLGSGGGMGTGGNVYTGGALAPGGTVVSGGNIGTGGTNGSGGLLGSGGRAGSAGGSIADAGQESSPGSDGGVASVLFSTQIQPMLNQNCTRCHGGSSPTSGIGLDTYAKVKANATAANGAIQSGRMPPGGALSAANKQLFQAWISEGMPNN